MSDGVWLAADVSYPADRATGRRASGDFPVIVTQTPYVVDRTDARVRQEHLVARGYIAATVHIRGTVDSDGEFGFLSGRDRQDSVEVIDWAASLAGSDGRVGLNGFSYCGLTQLLAAASVRPDSPLRAIRPAAIGNLFRGTFFVGGVPSNIFHSYFPSLGRLMGTESAAEVGSHIFDEVMSDGPAARYGAFWRDRSAEELAPLIVRNGIAVLLWSGWTDCYPASVFDLWTALRAAAGGTDPRFQLVVGPEHDIHDQERSDAVSAATTLRWYDEWVKGHDTGLREPGAALHLAEPASRSWFDFADYPLTSEVSELRLGRELTDRTAPAPPTSGIALEDEQQWISEPFDADTVIAGPMTFSAWVAVRGADAGLEVELSAIGPDSIPRRLTVGALLASARLLDEGLTWRDESGRVIRPYHRLDERSPMSGTTRLDIYLPPRLARIPRGHSIGLTLRPLDVSPADDPGWVPVPGRPTRAQSQALEGSRISLVIDHEHEAVLRLPRPDVTELRPSPYRWESDDED